MQVNPTGTAPPAPVTQGDGGPTLLGLGKYHCAITYVDPNVVNQWTGRDEWCVSFKCAMTGVGRKAWLDYAGVQNLIGAAFGRADRHFDGPELVSQEVGLEVIEFTRKAGTVGLKVNPEGFYSVTTFQAAPEPPALAAPVGAAGTTAAPSASNPFGG